MFILYYSCVGTYNNFEIPALRGSMSADRLCFYVYTIFLC